MQLGPLFERFLQASPIPVMDRALLERALDPHELDRLFHDSAQSQRTRELLFSSMVQLMFVVVSKVHPSVRSAYLDALDELMTSLTAVYAKLQGIEPEVCRGFVLHTHDRLEPIVRQLDGGTLPPLLPGYRTRILDGNHLAGTEHRPTPTRTTRAAALPGQALVVLDPATMLVGDVVPCEDAYAQERSLIDAVLERVADGDFWIADRNFCCSRFVFGMVARRGRFLVRQHQATLRWEEINKNPRPEDVVLGWPPRGGRFRAVAPSGGGGGGKAPPGPQRITRSRAHPDVAPALLLLEDIPPPGPLPGPPRYAETRRPRVKPRHPSLLWQTPWDWHGTLPLHNAHLIAPAVLGGILSNRAGWRGASSPPPAPPLAPATTPPESPRPAAPASPRGDPPGYFGMITMWYLQSHRTWDRLRHSCIGSPSSPKGPSRGASLCRLTIRCTPDRSKLFGSHGQRPWLHDVVSGPIWAGSPPASSRSRRSG